MESSDRFLILAVAAITASMTLVVALRHWWMNRVVRAVSEDDLDIRSERLRLSGRPDRLVEIGSGDIIPEEKKDTERLTQSAIMQLGTYFVLIEEKFGRRPPHGYVILEDNRRHKIRNTPKIRKDVMRLLKTLRDQNLDRPAKVRPRAAKCRECGFKEICTQRRR